MEEKLLQERKNIILDILKSKEYRPMKIKELAILLNISREDREELRYVLEALVYEGKVGVSKKGRYFITSTEIVTGTFEGNRKGFGFVKVEGEEEDIFIPERCVNGAMNRDMVQVAILTEDKFDKENSRFKRRKEGEVVRIVSHGTEEIVGIYQKSKNFGFVIPDDQKFNRDIFIPVEKSRGAVNGHKVVVKITDFGSKSKHPEGVVKEIIGHVNDPGTDIISIVKAYNIPTEFSDAVLNYVERIEDEVNEKEYSGRLDLRSLRTVTIDGEEAKDLDDAISLEKKGQFYHLGVHIADVSHYVRENSVLDKEALKRGTSVYLVDRVIPMLPQKLSNGICSLNQGCDRLALSCIMDIDEKGKVIGHQIAETVIRVDRRMTYTNVHKILQKSDEAVMEEYKDFVNWFELMQELSAILRQRRMSRGSIDFDFPESKISLDEKGVPVDKYQGRNIALIFEKTSTRTRCSFEVAANDMGMGVTYLEPLSSQIGKKESIADTARVLGRMYDGIEYRGFGQDIVEELARYAGVPVWNGLTNEYHPTQMLADLLTIREHLGRIKGVKMVYMGDARYNMGNSLLVLSFQTFHILLCQFLFQGYGKLEGSA